MELEIIKLDLNEKLKDNYGKVIEIELRGNRTHDNLYFKVLDIANASEIKNLNKLLSLDKYKFIDKVDYINVICNKKKTIFISYYALLQILFELNPLFAKQIIKWVSEKIFNVKSFEIYNEKNNKKIKEVQEIIGNQYDRFINFLNENNK
jgi:hypothetical protein